MGYVVAALLLNAFLFQFFADRALFFLIHTNGAYSPGYLTASVCYIGMGMCYGAALFAVIGTIIGLLPEATLFMNIMSGVLLLYGLRVIHSGLRVRRYLTKIRVAVSENSNTQE